MVNQHLLPNVLIGEPELPVRPQEEVDGRMSRERVERRLPEAGDDRPLPLDGHHLRSDGLEVHCGMVDLDRTESGCSYREEKGPTGLGPETH